MEEKELLIVGQQPFEVKLVDLGAVVAQRYLDAKGEKRTRWILFTWDGLWRKLGGPAYELKQIGFDIKHPIKFNCLFRSWLAKSCEIGKRIVDVYSEEKHWRDRNRAWAKEYSR